MHNNYSVYIVFMKKEKDFLAQLTQQAAQIYHAQILTCMA